MLHRIFFFYYFLIDLYWSIIASQYYASFCCTTRQISHIHTHVPISPPSWASLPSSLSHPSRSSQSTELISLCYAAASHQPTILHSLVYICPQRAFIKTSSWIFWFGVVLGCHGSPLLLQPWRLLGLCVFMECWLYKSLCDKSSSSYQFSYIENFHS